MGDHPVMKYALIALLLGFILGYAVGQGGVDALTSLDGFQRALGLGE